MKEEKSGKKFVYQVLKAEIDPMGKQAQFGLPVEAIESIRSVFRKYKAIDKVLVYGSRAKGNYKVGSDIDLMIVGPTLNTQHLLAIENELDDLLLPYQIDLSLQHYIENQDLLDHVRRVGQVFYGV